MLFFFHCQQWCVILYMFLMLTELSQNKVLQKEKQSAPVCFSICLNIQCAFSRDFTEAGIQSPLRVLVPFIEAKQSLNSTTRTYSV